MRRLTWRSVGVLLLVVLTDCAGRLADNAAVPPSPSAAADGQMLVCPVTLANGDTPPGEQPSVGHHGNGQLWTGLWPEGRVLFSPNGPGDVEADGSLSMKFWWWRGVPGQLVIEGRRLDAPAPPTRAYIPEGYGDSGFQATALIFPTTGCWEVTGRVGDASLTFVALVVQVPAEQ